jgi:hypothetical protein
VLLGAGVIVPEPRRPPAPSRRRPQGDRRPRAAEPRRRSPAASAAPPAPRRADVADTEPTAAAADEIVAVARALVANSSDGSVSLDALANALKERGFGRPPGSLRLVTRLRRIAALDVSPRGSIRLATP